MSSTRPQARGENSRLDVIRLLAFSMLLILPANSMAQQSPPIAEQIAKTYGLDSFGRIEAIRYTWNLETPAIKVSRMWECPCLRWTGSCCSSLSTFSHPLY